jgi:hypothetical protein
MRLVGCQRALIVTVALGLWSGCFLFEITPEQKARDVCTAYCDCVVSPAQVEQCIVDDCLPDIPPVSDPCLECVYANSQTCSKLLDDCTDLCVNPGTPLLGGM